MTMTHESAALQTIRETVDRAAGKVFGEPIHRDGLTVLPVAAVATGGGGGGGTAPKGTDASGEGGGFGVLAKPAGAFVIKDGSVAWRPAVDVNRVIMGGQIVAVVALFVARGIVKARNRRRLRHHHHGRLVRTARHMHHARHQHM
jgi:uncharacterized spore protein YtfJ